VPPGHAKPIAAAEADKRRKWRRGCRRAADASEGIEDAVTAVDEMVVDRDLHEHGVEREPAQRAGVHGIVGIMPRFAEALQNVQVVRTVYPFHCGGIPYSADIMRELGNMP
jgi:hypothetical protein